MEMLQRKKTFEEILIERGFIAPSDLEMVLRKIGSDKGKLGQILLDEGLLSEEQCSQVAAEQYNLPYYPLIDFHIDPSFYQTIPVEWMHKVPFVPYHEENGILTIAIPDPGNFTATDELEIILGKELKLAVSSRWAILSALKKSGSSSQVLKRLETEFKPILIREDEKGEDVLSVETLEKDAGPIVKLINTILLNALQKQASDIHMETSDKGVNIKYRIDGLLYPALEPIDVNSHSSIISRIKVMSELNITEKRIPQDGRFKLRLDKKTVDFRVSILPTIFGEDVVIRILDKEHITAGVKDLRLDRLGFKEEDLRKFRRAIIEPHGMVLVTGPTGSGKTTTLYAAISEINTGEDKIITIEDPVEYELRNVVQIPVNEKKGLTFAKGLRSILRHDPDKIMVGEIRDSETAQIAIQSALTGHLVFTTVHANNAFDVIGRFTNMGIEPYNFVSSLNCILAQRLVRMICQYCKEEVRLSRELCEDSGLDYERYKDLPLHQGKGCFECNQTGFKGRKAITEFLGLTDTIKEMILMRRPPSEIRKAAIAEGMTTLRQAGLEKVFKGETTLRDINKVTYVENI